ncbi:UNVERIFIED_CONTAM: Mce-associated membrane protein [Williamsia faeni]
MSRKFWWWTVSVLTVVILVAGVVITTITGLHYRDTKLTEDARGESLEAGTHAATMMFGYAPDNVAQQVEQTKTLLTGAAQKEYDEIITNANLVVAVKDQQVKSEVTIQEAGVVNSTQDTALLLIFMNQSVTKGGKDLVSIEASRLEYSMEKSGDKWLVSNIDILTDDSVKARLATEADKVGASTVPVPAPEGSATPGPAAPAPSTPAPAPTP